jgi:hypothetical protein
MTDSNQLEDWQLSLLVQARDFNSPALVEKEKAEALRDYRGLIDEAEKTESPVVVERQVKEQHEEAEALLDAAQGIDDWEVVDSDQREQEIEACESVRDALSPLLKEQNGLREPVVEAMGVEDMVEQFRDEGDDGEIKLESLSQQPETGGEPDDPTDDTDDDGSADTDSLSASDRNEVREKLEKANRMEQRTPEFSETLRQEAAEIAGVDDADEIDFEVL